jgi:hypothetical protein
MRRTTTLALAATLLATAALHARASEVIPISDVDALYASVADPANAGATLLLDATTFALDARGPLVLEPGMTLAGVPGATTIDGRAATGLGLGLIRIGRQNVVAGLVILAPTNAVTSCIDAGVIDAASPAGIDVEIRDCEMHGARFGVSCRHFGAAYAGLDSRATIENCTIADGATNFLGASAILVQNTIGADASRWRVTLRGNTCERCLRGLLMVSLSTLAAENDVLSMGNTYTGNKLGIVIYAGRDQVGSPGGARGSVARLTSTGDTITDNAGGENGRSGAGVTIYGGYHTLPANPTSDDNYVRADFLGATFAGNMLGAGAFAVRRDVAVVGSQGQAGIVPGTGDIVEQLFRQTTSDGAAGSFSFTDAAPADPTGTDEVTILGSDVAFESSNDGVPTVPDEFFDGGGE